MPRYSEGLDQPDSPPEGDDDTTGPAVWISKTLDKIYEELERGGDENEDGDGDGDENDDESEDENEDWDGDGNEDGDGGNLED